MDGLLILAAAAAVALALFALLRRLLRPRLGSKQRELLGRLAGPVRLAFVVVALAFALPIAALPEDILPVVEHGLLLAIMVLVGWGCLAGADFATELFVRRFEDPQTVAARKYATRARILQRAANFVIVLITLAAALMTFEPVRQWGVSLFASAGAAGLILGLAARPVLSNLIAGIQIAITQPIRIDDTVMIENEIGRIEEISSAFVVVRLADRRRMIVPLSHFIEKPFQNWTRESTSLLTRIVLRTGPDADVAALRTNLEEVARTSPLWDGRVCRLEVIDQTRDGVDLRAAVSAADPERLWELSCDIRERMLPFVSKSKEA